MNNRIQIFFALFVGLAVVSPVAARSPNVVIFLADDAGCGDYSQAGNRQVATPRIDSIARDGVSLERFFVCPVCSPTRAEMLTGRYHSRGGVRGVSTGKERLNLDEKTVADAFKAAGYATGIFGKWHNGTQWPYHPMARGFDEFVGYSEGHWGEYFDPPLEENGRMIRAKGYIVDILTARALNFIDRNKDRPFLCYIPFTTPHTPWAVPEADWIRFKDRPLTQPGTDPVRESREQTMCALAMIENQDANVGRVLAKLDALHLNNDTIVLYFSDNGPNTMRWTDGLRGIKGSTDEGGVRSVCYLRWPSHLPAGHKVEQIAGAIDLLPTLTSLAGIPRVGTKPLDGRDLTPLLMNRANDWPDRTIFSAWNNQISARTQRYRLDNTGRLYDMVDDPSQTRPINANLPGLAKRLRDEVAVWRHEVYISDDSKVHDAVDPRPIPVGYRAFPITMLPARDGRPSGGIRRSGTAPNSSYFVGWTSKEGAMTWLVDVQTTGRYSVSIDYTCPLDDAGSIVELTFGASRLEGRVGPGWDPPLYTNQDTLPRVHGESRMKEFHPMKLGVITLEKGQGTLTLHAKEIKRKTVMDVRRVTLTLLPSAE